MHRGPGRRYVHALIASLFIAPLAIAPTAGANHQSPCQGEPACIYFEEGQRLGDVVVPGLYADQDSPVLATIDYGEVLLRADVGPTYVSQRVVLAQVNGEPGYEEPVGPLQFEDRSGWCDESDPQFCIAYLVEPTVTEEFGVKVGELWLDRAQVWVGNDKWTDAPILRVR